jgi:hypothetical protein
MQIHVNTKAEACKIMLQHGKTMKVGAEAELTFTGDCIGKVLLHRKTERDLVILPLIHGANQTRIDLCLFGDMALVLDTVSAGEFFGSGATFTKANAPMAKPGKPLTAEAIALTKAANQALVSWKKQLLKADEALPEAQRKLSLPDLKLLQTRRALIAANRKTSRAA